MATEHERALQLDRALAGRPQGVQVGDELAPLLEQAEALRKLNPPKPSRAFVTAARYRLMTRIESSRPARAARPSRGRWISLPRLRRPALALASLVLAITMLLSGTGIAFAASNSLPGDPLYPIKQSYERGRLALTVSEQVQLRLLHRYANRRLQEIQALQRAKRAEDLSAAVANYDQAMAELLGALQAGPENQLEEIKQSVDHHQQVLQSVLERAPQSAIPGLENALERSSQSQRVLEALEEGRSPSEQAPGQQKKEDSSEPSEQQEVPPGQEKKTPGQSGDSPPGQEKLPGPPDGTPPGQGKVPTTPGPPPGKGPPEGRGGGPPD